MEISRHMEIFSSTSTKWYKKFLDNLCIPFEERCSTSEETSFNALTVLALEFKELAYGTYTANFFFFDIIEKKFFGMFYFTNYTLFNTYNIQYAYKNILYTIILIYCNFFGRQWHHSFQATSPVVSIDKTLYFHSSIKQERILIVVELVKNDRNPWAFCWTVIPVFVLNQPISEYNSKPANALINTKRYQLFRGSCRILLFVESVTKNEDKLQKVNGILVGMLQNCQELATANNYLPEHFFTDFSEFIPGLSFVNGKLYELPFRTAVLDHICLSYANFEQQMLKLLNKEHCFKMNKPTSENLPVLSVLERRLKVGVHNGLTYLEDPLCIYLQNSEDLRKKSQLLTVGKPLVLLPQSIFGNGNETKNNYVSRNSVRLTRLFADRFCAIIFSLEYLIGLESSEKELSGTRLVTAAWNAWCPFSGESNIPADTITVCLVGGPRPNPFNVRCLKDFSHVGKLMSGNIAKIIEEDSQILLKFNFATLESLENRESAVKVETPIRSQIFTKFETPVMSEKSDDQLSSKKIKNDEIVQFYSPRSLMNEAIGDKPIEIEEVGESRIDTMLPVNKPKSDNAANSWANNEQMLQFSPPLIAPFPRRIALHLAKFAFPSVAENSSLTPTIVDPTIKRQVDLNLERTSHLPINEISFQFMAIKFLKNSFYDLSEIRGPKHVFFTMRFYRFMLAASEKLLASEEDASELLTLHRIDEQENKCSNSLGFVIRFRIGILYSDSDDFIKYLAYNKLFIDAWDADSFIHLGRCTVPLRFLLRQNAGAIEANIQCSVAQTILSEKEPVTTALLYLRAVNLGLRIDRFERQFFRNGDSNFGKNHRIISKDRTDYKNFRQKARSLASIHNSVLQKFLTFQKLDIMQRKEDLFFPQNYVRIQQWNELKRRGLLSSAITNGSTKRFIFDEELEAYKEIRRGGKAATLLRAVFKGITTEHSINAKFGIVEYFEFILQNPSMDQIICTWETNDSRLRPITDADEWKFLRKSFGIDGQVERDFVYTDEKTGEIKLLLKPMESIQVPLKFDFFISMTGLAVAEETFTDNASVKGIFKKSESGVPLAILDLDVKYWNFAVTESFRWFHEEKRRFSKVIKISPVQHAAKQVRIMSFRVTDPTVVCSLQNNSYGEQSFSIMFHTDESPSIKEFIVLLYSDRYQTSLIHAWHFSIHSMCKLNVEAIQGQKASIPLQIKAPFEHLIELHSSSQMISFVPHYSFMSSPQILSELKATLIPTIFGVHYIIITAVEKSSSRVLKSWLILLNISEQISKIFDVHLTADSENIIRKKIAFKNPYAIPRLFRVYTSNPSLATIQNEFYPLKENEATFFEIVFPPQPKRNDPFQTQVQIFVENSDNSQHEETYSVKICYE